jgi:hypothetical protein
MRRWDGWIGAARRASALVSTLRSNPGPIPLPAAASQPIRSAVSLPGRPSPSVVPPRPAAITPLAPKGPRGRTASAAARTLVISRATKQCQWVQMQCAHPSSPAVNSRPPPCTTADPSQRSCDDQKDRCTARSPTANGKGRRACSSDGSRGRGTDRAEMQRKRVLERKKRRPNASNRKRRARIGPTIEVRPFGGPAHPASRSRSRPPHEHAPTSHAVDAPAPSVVGLRSAATAWPDGRRSPTERIPPGDRAGRWHARLDDATSTARRGGSRRPRHRGPHGSGRATGARKAAARARWSGRPSSAAPSGPAEGAFGRGGRGRREGGGGRVGGQLVETVLPERVGVLVLFEELRDRILAVVSGGRTDRGRGGGSRSTSA